MSLPALLILGTLAANPVPAEALPAVPNAAAAQVQAGDGVRVNWPVDGAITFVTGSGWIASELMKKDLAPSTCHWCSAGRFDNWVTDQLSWNDLDAGNTVGDIGGFGVMPVLALGGLALGSADAKELGNFPEDALLVVQAVAVSSALNQLVKFSVGRERPFVDRLPADQKRLTEHPEDNNLSFYSGHSNLVFAMAVSAGTVAHLRGYKTEPYIWGFGLPVAAFVAYSRIASQRHYVTDVLLGSAAGAAFGFLLPWLHRDRDSESGTQTLTVAPGPGGASFAFAF